MANDISELKEEIRELSEKNQRLQLENESQNQKIEAIITRIDQLQIHLDNGWRKELINMLLKMQWKIILIVGSLSGGVMGVLSLLANKI